MKVLPGWPKWVAISLLLAGASAPGATNTASLRLYCLSVKVEPAQATAFGLFYTLQFSSYYNWTVPNGEFFRLFRELPPSHSSGFLLSEGALLGDLEGGMDITVPEGIDANQDRVPDFYQVAQPMDAMDSSGSFVLWDSSGDLVDAGGVQTHWQRAAGSHRGVCILNMQGQGLVPPLEFQHPFEIIEYAGALNYQPAATNVSGLVTLSQVGDPTRSFAGTLFMARGDPLPTQVIDCLPSTWTNALLQTVAVEAGQLGLDPHGDLDYFGSFWFEDGDPSHPDEPDYERYFAGIDDPNDWNANGIPDLTDPPPRIPLGVAIARDAAGLILLLTGQTGATYSIESASELPALRWIDAATVVLSNATQAIPLPPVAGNAAFWRARAI